MPPIQTSTTTPNSPSLPHRFHPVPNTPVGATGNPPRGTADGNPFIDLSPSLRLPLGKHPPHPPPPYNAATSSQYYTNQLLRPTKTPIMHNQSDKSEMQNHIVPSTQHHVNQADQLSIIPSQLDVRRSFESENPMCRAANSSGSLPQQNPCSKELTEPANLFRECKNAARPDKYTANDYDPQKCYSGTASEYTLHQNLNTNVDLGNPFMTSPMKACGATPGQNLNPRNDDRTTKKIDIESSSVKSTKQINENIAGGALEGNEKNIELNQTSNNSMSDMQFTNDEAKIAQKSNASNNDTQYSSQMQFSKLLESMVKEEELSDASEDSEPEILESAEQSDSVSKRRRVENNHGHVEESSENKNPNFTEETETHRNQESKTGSEAIVSQTGRKRPRSPTQIARVKRHRRIKANDRERNR